MYENSIGFEWCIGVYQGDRAQSVLAHANAGIGYFIRRSEGSGKALVVEAAFRRPLDSPRPEHLVVADPVSSMKLDRMFEARHPHVFQNNRAEVRASTKTVNSVRDMLEKRKQDKANAEVLQGEQKAT